MSEDQVSLLVKYLGVAFICNLLMYLLCGFLCWDIAWISDIGEWHGSQRFMLFFFVALFNIGYTALFVSLLNEDIRKVFNKED